MWTLNAHAKLELAAFVTEWACPLVEASDGDALAAWTRRAAPPRPPGTKGAVRDLLRVGGFKPSGRNKPASEYVARAIPEGRLGPINAAVDACNAASFVSGLPISVVDLDRVSEPLRVGIADGGARYVFNASEQVIDVSGLLCLHDGMGPCANAVKDSHRTKTSGQTTRTLSLIWGTVDLPGHAAATAAWYRKLIEEAGHGTRDVSWEVV